MESAFLKNPPMGWNSWDCYGAAVTEATVRANAEYMAKHLKSFGWEYVVVDIQWANPTAPNHDYQPFADLCMDEWGRLLPAPVRFPSAAGGKGFAPLADYVHSLGLKFGIHIMRGIPRQAVHQNTPVKGSNVTARQIAKTASICQWNTDMYGVDPEKEGAEAYYDSLFELYAAWGVDFVKVDDICRELPQEEGELVMLSRALHRCGRDMVLSLSPGPALLEKAELYKQVSNMWRITDDFWDRWELLYAMFERAEKWCIHSGPGCFPDADMLPVGAILQDYDENGWTKFTPDEQKTMMTLWCVFRSPLMIGGELTKCDDFTLGLLTNERVLEMSAQARSSHPLFRQVIDGNEIILWHAYRRDGGAYLALFNAGETTAELTLPLARCQIEEEAVTLTDLWSGQVHSDISALTCRIPPHGAAAWRTES